MTMKNMIKRGVMVLLTAIMLMCSVPIQEAEASDTKIPASAKEFNGHYYKVYSRNTLMTWKNAKQRCEALGGHLVTITSAKEAVFITNLVEKANLDIWYGYDFWIGAHQENGKWKWITKESTSYKPYEGWPTIYEDCPYCTYNSKYEEIAYSSFDSSYYNFICEWDKGSTSKKTKAPAKVKLHTVVRDGDDIYLEWNKVKGVSGYTIYEKYGKYGEWSSIGSNSSKYNVCYVEGDFESGDMFYYKVRAYKKVNGKKVYGKYSNVKSIKIK